MSAGQYPRTRCNRLFHISVKRSDRVGIRQGTKLRAVFEWIADAKILHPLNELALELTRNSFRHDKALGCDARLAVILHAGIDRSSNRRLKIGARHHDEGIASTQLEHHFLDALRRRDSNLNSGLLTSRQSR